MSDISRYTAKKIGGQERLAGRPRHVSDIDPTSHFIIPCVLTFDDGIHIISQMQLLKSTIEKFADTLIRFGEAAVIGSTATFFVEGFQTRTSILGLIGGFVLVTMGLFVNEISVSKGK